MRGAKEDDLYAAMVGCWIGKPTSRNGSPRGICLRARHILPLLAMGRTKYGSGVRRWRWVVERPFAWLNQFRRLRVCYDKRVDIHEALSLTCQSIGRQRCERTCEFLRRSGARTRPSVSGENERLRIDDRHIEVLRAVANV